MNQTLRIREATFADALAIAKIHVRGWQQTYVGQLPAEYLKSLDSDIERRTNMWQRVAETRPERTALLVAEFDGDVVGFVNVAPTRDEDLDPGVVGELGVLYLLEEYWGQGIGKQLHDEGMQRLQGIRLHPGDALGARQQRSDPNMVRAPGMELGWCNQKG